MNALYDWLIESDVQLKVRRKRQGYLTIQRTMDRDGLIIQADEPSPTEIQAIRAAQLELESNSRGESLVSALEILEPYTNGVFVVGPFTQD